MAASGSGGYGGPNFSGIENSLRNIALQFGSILSLTQQINASIQTFRLFERELTLANFAAGGTVETFGKMESAARNMALGSTNSVSQLGNAFGNLARAGLDAAEVLSAVTGVMLLANATLSDLGEAADITASTMAQFNLRADESNRIANLFVAASNNSLASMNKLAFAMRQVGPIAAQANLSLETTVGMLDKLFDAGLRGEQAGTALRNVISRLVDPMGEGKAVLENLGVSALDAKGQVNIDLALRKLAEMNLSLKDVSNIAGVEAAAGMLTLLDSIRNTNDGLDSHITKISGTNDAYKQALAQMATLDGSLSQAANAFNELRLIAGEAMAPVLIDLTQNFVDLVLYLRELDPAVVQTTLQFLAMAAGSAVLLKGLSMIAPAFTAGGKAMASFRDATTAATNSFAAFGAGLPITGMKAASNSITSMGSAMLGFAGIAAGVLGVAAALIAVAVAVKQVQDAKDKAKLNELIGETGLNPEQAQRNLRNTNLQFNVDEESGSGAIQKYGALMEQAKGASGEADDAQKQIADLYTRQQQRGEDLVKQIRDLNKLSDNVNIELLGELNAGGGQLTQTASALGAATAEQWPKAVEAMKDAYLARIRNSNRSDAAKSEMIAEAEKTFATLGSVDAEIRVKIQEAIRKQQASGDDVVVESDLLQGSKTASTLARVFDFAENAFVLNKRQFEERSEELMSAQGDLLTTVQKAEADAQALLPAMRTEIGNFVRTAYGSSTEVGNETATAIDRWIEKNPERFYQIIREAGNDTAAIIRQIGIEGQIAVSKIQGALDALATGTIPRVNKEAIDSYWAKALKETVQTASGTVEASVLASARDAQRVAGANTWRGEATEIIGAAISENQGGQIAKAIVAGIESGTIKTVEDARVAIERGGGMLSNQTREAGDRAIQAARMLYESNTREAMTLGAKTGGSRGGGGARRAQNTANRAMDKILDLPTEAEFRLEADKLAMEVRNSLANYFGFEVDAYRIGIEEAQIDYREKQIDLQRDFEKFWRDNIAKGLDIAVNQDVVNAIAGRGFSINGVSYTTSMLEAGGEEAKKYTDALLEYITPQIPASAPQYQARIDALKRVVARLGEQASGVYAQLAAELRTLEISKREVQQAAAASAQAFDLQNALDMLQSELDLVTLRDPLNVQMRAQLQFQIEVADIGQQANSQIKSLQDNFKEQFENIGVFAEISGNDIQVNRDANPNLTDDQLTRIQALTDQYMRMRDAILEVADATKMQTEAALYGTEAWREGIDMTIEGLRYQSDTINRGRDSMADLADGMRAGYLQVAKDIPTYFETAMSGTSQLITGFGDLFAQTFMNMGGQVEDWEDQFRMGTSQIMNSIAMMIVKMLVMAATLQLIRMIPGGTALLSMMDAAAGIGKVAQTAVGAAGAGNAAAAAAGGGRVTVNAQGGIHDHEQMMAGGVKRPGQTSMAIFGEGQHPEAFIPMVDGATIPVTMGQDGRYYVQLPSGQKVPVSMKTQAKKHAFGGIMGNVTQASRTAADQAAFAGNEATGYSGGGRRTAELAEGGVGGGFTFVGGPITIMGDAREDTPQEIAKQQAEQFGGLLKAHESEQTRQRLRREGRSGFSHRGTI